jgi:hypothetical protein
MGLIKPVALFRKKNPINAFTPLAFNPTFWLDPVQITGISDGNEINNYNDSTGNGNNFQGSVGFCPYYRTNGINGKPSLDVVTPHNGSLASNSSITSAANWWMSMVVQPSTDFGAGQVLSGPVSYPFDQTNYKILYSGSNSTINVNQLSGGSQALNNPIFLSAGVPTALIMTGSPTLLSIQTDADYLARRGYSGISTDSGSKALSPFYIYAFDNGSAFFYGKMGDVLYGTGSFDDTKKKQLLTYYHDKWGTIAPPTINDELLDLTFELRLQTYCLSSMSPIGLWQDSGHATPSKNAGDFVHYWGDNIGTSVKQAIQTDNTYTPVLQFDVNGIPYLNFSNAYFTLPDASSLSQGEMFLLYRNNTPTDGNTIYSMSDPAHADDPNTYLPFTGGGVYDSFGSTTRKNSIPANFYSGYNLYNVSSKNGEWRNALNGVELFSTGTNTVNFSPQPAYGAVTSGAKWSGGGVVAIFLFSTVLNAATRLRVYKYLSKLKPYAQ